MDSQISRVRAELSLPRAWKILGLPGEPKVNCDLKSPFRQDKKPSFRIYEGKDHLRFFDHGDASGGDVIDLWAIAKGIDVRDALHQILDYLGGKELPGDRLKAPQRPAERVLAPREVETAGDAIQWPENLKPPTEDECRQLGVLRSLSPEAFFLAGRLGTLLMGDQRGQRLWITADQRMRSAARRRLDGQPLEGIGKKSASPKGAPRDWIIGTQTANSALDALKTILVVEGEGDYYAGLQIAIESEINFKVLAILGAATKTFHAEALEQFRGATVSIIPHNDRSGIGEKAAIKWANQIQALGAIDCFIQRLPIVCDDLNDFLIQRPDAGHQLLKGFHDGISPERPK